ncbi:MAG: hypothetical protein LVS60_15300 [Nodosilinea sp. LVE1205-7]
MAISPDRAVPPRRQGWRVGSDCHSHCSQPVDLGEGATGAGRKADREVYLRVRELVARASGVFRKRCQIRLKPLISRR